MDHPFLSTAPHVAPTNKLRNHSLDKHKLHSIHPQKAVTAAYQAVSSLQDFPPHEQLAGIALLLHVMALNTNTDVSQLLQASQRIAGDADSNYTTTIRALREYVRQELTKG